MSLADEIKAQVISVANLDVDEATARPGIGDVNFKDVQQPFLGIIRIAARISDFDFDLLPLRNRNNLKVQLTNFLTSVGAMQSFNLEIENPPARRNQIKKEFESHLTAVFDQFLPPLIFLGSSDASTLRSETEALVAKIRSDSEAADQAVAAIRKAAGQTGMTREAEHFSIQADEHRDAANWWLAMTILFVGLTALWGVVALFVLTIDKDASNVQLVHNSIGKLIILSGLYFGLVWCGRNYRASRHNYVVNKHRKNSLSTFETFVSAAGSDEAVKNAVLLQATTSIFNAQASGYANAENDTDVPTKIIEISKSFSSSKAPG